MAKQNYRQVKKQKETARKARQVEKQHKRQKVDQPGAADGDVGSEPPDAVADAPAGAAQVPTAGG